LTRGKIFSILFLVVVRKGKNEILIQHIKGILYPLEGDYSKLFKKKDRRNVRRVVNFLESYALVPYI